MNYSATLILMNGAETPKYVLDVKGVYFIGRGEECDLSIPKSLDPSVSRLHCQVHLTESGVFVRDIGSSNGTFVNEEQLIDGNFFKQSSETIPYLDKKVDSGDVLRVGNSSFSISVCETVPEKPINQIRPKSETNSNQLLISTPVADPALPETTELLTVNQEAPQPSVSFRKPFNPNTGKKIQLLAPTNRDTLIRVK